MIWLLAIWLFSTLARADTTLRGVDPEDAAADVGEELDPYALDPHALDPHAALLDSARTAAHAGNWDDALGAYTRLLILYPGDPDALVGRGLVHSWAGNYARAAADLATVARAHPEYVDAWLALANVYAWSGRTVAADSLLKAAEQSGQDEVAARLRARTRASARDPGEPAASPATVADLPPLALPDTLCYPARVNGPRFEVRTDAGWRPFYIKGVNLGAALPGKFPSQFPDRSVYAEWIAAMGAMNANVIRVYTIHPPHFYEELLKYNRAHPSRPLWLVHGVWAELPPADDYTDPAWEAEFFAEIHRVVDLIHGRADLPQRPGHASGSYRADVSPWTLAFIIGREWEPFSVQAFAERNPAPGAWNGSYLRVHGGNAMDVWLAKACEEVVAYETEGYHAQRPVAYTNWPTLDPLVHPTEMAVADEVALRRSLGETVVVAPREYDNDVVSLDAALVEPTDACPAGYFAAYHAYPYYPDFMVLDDAYGTAASSRGRSHYFGYLEALHEHHADMPVVVAEYGVPASLGIAHLQPQGAHHGGHDEGSMARWDQRLSLEIAEAGLAGGIVFAWIDEWFKKNWLVMDFELPADRNRLWYNRLDAEQHYGMFAAEPVPAVPGATLAERVTAWRRMPPIATSAAGASLRAATDAAYLWLLLEADSGAPLDEVMVGFDVIDAEAGSFRWPGSVGPRLPAGVEFVLEATEDTVRVLAHPGANPFFMAPLPTPDVSTAARVLDLATGPPGYFRGRCRQSFRLPIRSVARDDGRYEPLRVITNRRRFARDRTEYLAVGYDRGVLWRGEPPDGSWQRLTEPNVLEVRIPWLLLNVTDPSSRSVLQGEFEPVTVPDIGLIVASRDAQGIWTSWRAAATETAAAATTNTATTNTATANTATTDTATTNTAATNTATTDTTTTEVATVARFTWPRWQEPRSELRERPVYRALGRTFARLDPYGAEAAPDDGLLAVSPAPPTRHSALPETLVVAFASADSSRVFDDPQAAAIAWDEGRTADAALHYAAILARHPADETALHRLALLRAWSERYDESLELFDTLLARYPENWNAHIDRARVLAWSGDLPGALRALETVLAKQPDQVAALEAQGQFLAWAGSYDASLAAYDRLLAIAPDSHSAPMARARVLSWAARFDAAEAAYDSILAVDPTRTDAKLGLARVQAYDNRLDDSIATYRSVLASEPENVAALSGLATALGWRGNLVAGEAAWRRALVLAPQDPEIVAGFSRNLRWQGRTAAAYELVGPIAASEPVAGPLREEMRWISAALGTRAAPSVVTERDSDGNRITTTAVGIAAHLRPRLGLRLDGYRRRVRQHDLAHTTQGLTATVSYQYEPGWSIAAGLGGSRADAGRRDVQPTARFTAATPARNLIVGALSYATSALDATAALVKNGVVVQELSTTVSGTPAVGWRARAGVSWARFRAQETNHRWALNGAVVRYFNRNLSLDLGARRFTFARDLNEGYFDPDFYGIVEVTARWKQEMSPCLLILETSPGLQRVGHDGSLAGTFRGSARLTLRLAPDQEISLSVLSSTSGMHDFSTSRADYRYSSLSLAASWGL